MLKAEDNEILTRVGPGTLMGELLRRYWTPACLSAEIPEPGSPPARVRLLGENLVAFRDTRGRVGLVQENCPHRGASLYFGRNEDASLRCVYHGWAFDVERQLRRHAQRAGPVLREGPDEVLPRPRVRRDRLDLHGPARHHDPVPRLRHRGTAPGEVVGHQDHHHLQLGAGDGRQHRHLAHLPPAPVGRHRRPPRRRLRQARLPVQRDVVEVLAARPRPPARGRRHLVRLPLRRHPHHPQRQHPRARHRLRRPVHHDGRQRSLEPAAGALRPHGRRAARPATASRSRRRRTSTATAARTCSRSRRSPTRSDRVAPGSCRASTPQATTTRSTARSSAPPPSAASPTS